MNSTQISLISALVSADFFKDKPEAKRFQEFADGILKDIKLTYLVTPLVEKGYLTNQHQLTLKGKLSIIHNPQQLSDLQLSMNTKFHLVEGFTRNSLVANVIGNKTKKGTVSFLPDEVLKNLLYACLQETVERSVRPDFYIDEDTALFIQELVNIPREGEQNVTQPFEVTDLTTEEVVLVSKIDAEVEAEVKPKKPSKKKQTV